MKCIKLSKHIDAVSPAGASVRLLINNQSGGVIHSTVPPKQINKAIVHKTVDELWYVLEGNGEIWRDDGNSDLVTKLEPGVCIDILVGTRFQYRNTGTADLTFLCITIPEWPGPQEAEYVSGIWEATL